MELISVFKQFLQQHPRVNRQRWLLAISGGKDSIALASICQQLQIPFAIAHCNFNLRGEESLRDRQFVEAAAHKWGVPFFVKDFDTESYVAETGKSIQVAARELRYQWFNELVITEKIPFIVTAHHADDNAETVLMHLFRGTGIKGLRGMLPIQGNIIRPLLHVSREMIDNFVKENELTWVEDSSNETDKYTRNHFRHHLFPLIRQAIPHSYVGFENSIHLLTDTEILYKEAVDLHKKKLMEKVGNETHIPVLKLAKLATAKTILFETLSEFDFTAAQLDDAFALLEAESGKYVSSQTHRIIRNRAWLIIAPKKTEEATNILIERDQHQIFFQEGILYLKDVKTAPAEIISITDKALLDASEIQFPLILRPWKQGDYFYPLGMQKKKKLSKFFIDNKLSKTDKEKTWVVESNKKILWILGLRIDDRFKLKSTTQNVLELSFTKNVDV